MTPQPDISRFILHKVIVDVDLDGIVVPGLVGRFFSRREGARIATAGLYSYAGVRLLLSWGYRDQAHCAFTCYWAGDEWSDPHPGCPRVTHHHDTLVIDTGVTTIRLPTAGTAPELVVARPGAEAG